MIERLSSKLAASLKGSVPDHPISEAKLKFGIHIILNTVLTISVAVILGIIIDDLSGVMLSLFSFALLRAVSGGIHVKIAVLCIIVSAGSAAAISFTNLLSMPSWLLNSLNAVSLLLILCFAPSRIEKQTRIPAKYYPLLKLISFVIVAMNFFIDSPILAVTWFIQGLTLIKPLGKKEKK